MKLTRIKARNAEPEDFNAKSRPRVRISDFESLIASPLMSMIPPSISSPRSKKKANPAKVHTKPLVIPPTEIPPIMNVETTDEASYH